VKINNLNTCCEQVGRRGTDCKNTQKPSVVTTEEYNGMVNSEELERHI
jgi:hypothetical protein